MKTSLLKSIALISPIVLLAAGCKGPSEGTDYGFKGNEPITFADEALNVVIDEDSEAISIDLLSGAYEGDKALSYNTPGVGVSQVAFSQESIIWDPNAEDNDEPLYGLPVPTEVVNGKQVTPFFLDGNLMHLTPKAFGDRLLSCSTFEPGVSPNPWPRPTHTYTVTFNVLNGGVPATRTMNITINGVDSVVEEIQVENMVVKVGGTAEAGAEVMPADACDQTLEYSIADTTIATVDSNGMVSGISAGTTQLTVTNPASGVSKTVDVTVDSKFQIDVTNANGPRDALTKEVAACTHGALHVEPTPANGEALSGVYTYSWQTADAAIANPVQMDADKPTENGEWAILSTANGDQSPAANVASGPVAVDVAYVSGSTSTPAGDIEPLSVALSTVPNKACEKKNLDGGDTNWDHTFSLLQNWHTYINGNFSQVTGDPIFGDSLRVEATDATTENGVVQTAWTKGTNAFDIFSSFYGSGTRGHGKQLAASMWVKLEQPRDGVKVHFNIGPWNDSRMVDGKAGSYPNAKAHGSDFYAELENTTRWQFVQLKEGNQTPNDPSDDTDTYTIPTTWAMDGTQDTTVLVFVYASGLQVGDAILFDDLAMEEK